MSAPSSAPPRLALRRWIQPQHLDPAAAAPCRHNFQAGPTPVLVLDGFLREEVAERIATLMETDALFTRHHLLYPGEAVPEAAWQAAPEDRRFSRDEALTGLRPERRLGPGVAAHLGLRAALRGEAMIELVETLTGLPLSRRAGPDIGLVKRMRQGDFIAPHDDLVSDRALALNIHLSRGWRPDLGGRLSLSTAGGAGREIDTGWNRAMLIPALPGLTHSVTPVTPAAEDRSRLTIGSWYLQPQAGSGRSTTLRS